MPPFCFTAINVNVNIRPCQYLKDFSSSPDKIYGRPSLLFCSGQPSFSGVPISPTAPKAVWRFCIDYIQLWAVVVCKLPSYTKVQSCPPKSSLQLLKTLFGSQVLVFLRGESQESLECHMVSPKSLSPCSWEQQSYPGALWARAEGDHITRRPISL